VSRAENECAEAHATDRDAEGLESVLLSVDSAIEVVENEEKEVIVELSDTM